MSPTKSVFRTLAWFSRFAGILSIGNTKYSRKIRLFFYVYLVLMFVMFLFQAVQVAYLLYSPQYTDDGFANITVFSMFINTSAILYHYIFRSNKIEAHFNSISTFVDECLCDLLKNEFEQRLKKCSEHRNLFTKLVLLFVYTVGFFEFATKAFSYSKLIAFNKEDSLLILQVLYKVSDREWYWPTLIIQLISCCFLVAVDQTNSLYMQSMLVLKTECFLHLRRSLNHILWKNRYYYTKSTTFFNKKKQCKDFISHEKFESKNEDVMMVKLWIERHAKLKSLCKEFVKIYTPLLISYFSVMFVILISGVFSITQNQHYYGLAEEILLGLYFLGIIFNLFMLSIAGTNLSFESIRVFDDAFHAPWYDCSPEVKSSLKIISIVSRRPVRLAAFGSRNFSMSLDTFIKVMKTMISFYIGLAQMKQRLANKM